MIRPERKFYSRIGAYTRLHARWRPTKIAVQRNDETINYARLDEDLRRMTIHIARYGMKSGAIVAISHGDLYIQMLAVFACENLGLVSGSYRPDEGPECAPLIGAAQLILAQEKVNHPTSGVIVRLDQDWIDTALRITLPPVGGPLAPMAAGEMLVIYRSSGTTGTPKLMPISMGMHRHRDTARRQRQRTTARTRYQATMHLSVGTVYSAVHRLMRQGGTFLFDVTRPIAESLLDFSPTDLTILPYNLRQMLTRLPEAHTPKLPDLTIHCIGARTSDELRAAAAKKLGCKIREAYGTNEIGGVGIVDETGILTLDPGIVAEIIAPDQPDDIILGPDEIGVLRLRSATMITGYLNDPAATAAMFRNGWFYPGDLAAMPSPGRLRLIGRRADVLNLGGIKTGAAGLEGRLLQFPGLLDVALFQPVTSDQTSPVIVAAVMPEHFNRAAFAKFVGETINFPFSIAPVRFIPRTAEGKIKRADLEQALRPLGAATAPPDSVRRLEPALPP